MEKKGYTFEHQIFRYGDPEFTQAWVVEEGQYYECFSLFTSHVPVSKYSREVCATVTVLLNQIWNRHPHDYRI